MYERLRVFKPQCYGNTSGSIVVLFFLEENELINHDQRSKHYNYGGITKRLLGLVTKKQLILNLNTFHGQHSSIFHIPLGYKSAR